MFKQKLFNIMKIASPFIMILAVVAAVYFYVQLAQLKKNPTVTAQKEVTELVAKVSKLVVLPTGETPTVATVSDPTALKDQVFFAHAQKGDKVLIYTTAKKAILYSVSLNKILDVAPLNIGNATPKAATPTPTPTPTPTSTTPVKK